jgi:hypothetical protein
MGSELYLHQNLVGKVPSVVTYFFLIQKRAIQKSMNRMAPGVEKQH